MSCVGVVAPVEIVGVRHVRIERKKMGPNAEDGAAVIATLVYLR